MVRPAGANGQVERASMTGDFRSRLRAARLRAGLTQAALADGRYTKAYVSALENGLSRPSVVALDYLAARLGMSPTELLGDGPTRWPRVEADRLAAGDWQIPRRLRSTSRRKCTRCRAEVQRGRARRSAGPTGRRTP
jgi:transcriptional regulator with XRE-family HTH domain